jgi:hypothetical protein
MIANAMGELRKVGTEPAAYVSESNFFEKDWQRSYWVQPPSLPRPPRSPHNPRRTPRPPPPDDGPVHREKGLPPKIAL